MVAEGTIRDGVRLTPSAERILRTAARLFALNGYSATSTRDIAAAVGVQQPALYKHFSSKDDILSALVKLGLGRPVELAEAMTRRPGRAAAQLCRWLAECVRHLQGSPYVLVSIITTPELGQEHFASERALLDRLDRLVAELIGRGQREGDLRPMDPLSASRLVMALFDAMAMPEIAVRGEELIDFAMNGLVEDRNALEDIYREAAALDLASLDTQPG
ncbi:TetR/AcrR family transcriptional regulator [Nonomuraea sp. SYSU D8015]|uniref:TetR/AcrR family transcriptional regulator n=1 Tax=Nonomuraea sp. SYSU D8015 TaxID=2593644 RepID=UPI00166168D7|nr:TetR/AcrR family transcriptional regulator [Nonomuraea sp. SYSU D8015]